MAKCSCVLHVQEDVLCGAYSKSKRPDGLHWAHYPNCCPSDCPREHPELLVGAVLECSEES